MSAEHWPCPNGCIDWCRPHAGLDAQGKPVPTTNHHPHCQYVDDSLIDVWSVCIPGESTGCVVDNEEAARAMASEDPEAPLEVVKTRMHREVYENLPEFGGF